MDAKDKKNLIYENRYYIISIIIIVFAVIGILSYNKFFNSAKTYVIVNGYVEKISSMGAYLLKNEKNIEINKKESAIPIIAENTRVAKNQTIAIYKNLKYDEYLKQIENIDTQIQTIIKDLPPTYSSEVNSLDDKINSIIEDSNKETSYVKMQEYKNTIDDLAYQRITLLSQLSPIGSKIRDLIEIRNNLDQKATTLSDNIKSTSSGIVTYKIDGEEDIVDFEKINEYDAKKLEEIIEKYNNTNSNDFGIKVVDNFCAYILLKEPLGDNDKYIKEGKNYNIRVNDKENLTVLANLEKNIKTENDNYLLFKIKNNIEELVNLRKFNVEVIWSKVSGMAIPVNAVNIDEKIGYSYITIIKGGEYVNVPIEVKLSSDSICIIDNIPANKKKELNINNNNVISLYDQVIIN